MKLCKMIFFSLVLGFPLFLMAEEPVKHETPNPFPPSIQKMIESISDEDAVAFLQKERPEQMKSLEAMKTASPEQYKRRLQLAKMQLMQDQRMQKENPELRLKMEATRKNRTQILEKVGEYQKETEEAKKSALKSEIQVLLNQDFDASLENQKTRLTQMKERLAEQEKKLKDQESEKAKLVEERLERLLSQRAPMPSHSGPKAPEQSKNTAPAGTAPAGTAPAAPGV